MPLKIKPYFDKCVVIVSVRLKQKFFKLTLYNEIERGWKEKG